MNDFFQKYKNQKDKSDLYFYRGKLCSVKQFVGNGNIFINTETTTFNSISVEVIVTRENGKNYTLFCDNVISNGIKIGEIDEDFLLHEEFENEELSIFTTNCCIFKQNEDYIIKLDNAYNVGGWWDFLPIEEPDDERFSNKSFKKLCRISDYIGKDGCFYKNISDNREFVITRFKNDISPVRLLCSQELDFQLSNGKNLKDLLEHYIAIYVNDNGQEFLRIFDVDNIMPQPWHRSTGILFIIEQVIKNPFQYSFVNLTFNEKNYLKIK